MDIENIKRDLRILISNKTKPLSWNITVYDLVTEILHITGLEEEKPIEYPVESEVTGSEDWRKVPIKKDWIDEARSKAKEDENHLRQENANV